MSKYWSGYAVFSFIFGLIALFTVPWWYICFAFAFLSFVVTIWGYKLGGKELNIFGIVTSSCAVGLYIILAAFTYVSVVRQEVTKVDKPSIMNQIDISTELKDKFKDKPIYN